MKKITSLVVSILTLTLFSFSFSYADENVKKLSNFQKTGAVRGVVIEQNTKFAENVKKNCELKRRRYFFV